MLTRVAAYTNAIEAHLARLRLEAEGVPAYVAHEHHIGANWTMSVALGGVKVYVHPDDADRAKTLIAAHDRGEFALADEETPSCPQCQGTNIARGRLSWKAALLAIHLANVPLCFHWATLRCQQCRHEWDLPNTRAHPALAVLIATTAIATVFLMMVLAGYCYENLVPSAVFPPTSGGCR